MTCLSDWLINKIEAAHFGQPHHVRKQPFLSQILCKNVLKWNVILFIVYKI